MLEDRRKFFLAASGLISTWAFVPGHAAASASARSSASSPAEPALAPQVFEAPAEAGPGDRSPALPSPAHQETRPLRLGEIPRDFWERPRTLRLMRAETGERLEATYWENGKINASAYWQICALLRDVRAHRMTAMDPAILGILRGMQGFYEAWNYRESIIVTSGFRTQATNLSLGESAARNSMHLYGKAVDVRVPGVSAADVGRLASHFQRGGVGFYLSKGFVHIDTGRVRAWRG